MLYYFLLDDVARKQPKKAVEGEVELVESLTGEMVPNNKTKGVLRTRSEKQQKRKHTPGFPLTKKKHLKKDSTFDDESLPNSPQLPAFATKTGMKDEVRKGESRLTM